MIGCCVIWNWSKLLKNKLSGILKFVVCKQGTDIENVTDSEENTQLIERGKNAILACNYYISDL